MTGRFWDGAIDALARAAMWTLAIGAIAGATHLVSILAMPRLAPQDAYARVAAVAPTNRVALLPEGWGAQSPSPAGLFPRSAAPFEDPALVRGVCLYDLAKGPVRLIANPEPERLLLLSFHSRRGDVYYSMTDRSATRGHLEALLFSPEQQDDVEANDSDDELPRELRIVSPTPQGMAIISALAETAGAKADARARVAGVVCGLDRDMAKQAAN